ncbi:Unconventional myosin-Ie [Bienertia sinuspersici]
MIELFTQYRNVFVPFSTLQLPCSSPDIWNGLSSGFSFDHIAGIVALPTDNYRIQFYSLYNDTEISEVKFTNSLFQLI